VSLDASLAEDNRQELRAVFSALEARVDLSGTHTADKKTAPAGAAGDADLSAKIRAFQKEKNLASFADAAAALFAASPELFEEDQHD
jgi:hypothetical protein